MLNLSFSKLLKLSLVVLLAMVFISCFTKNVSYAISYTDFITELSKKVNDLTDNSTLKYNIQKFLNFTNETNTGQYWVDTTSIGVYFNSTKANSNSAVPIYIYFINDSTDIQNFRLGTNDIYFPSQKYTLLQMYLWSSGLRYNNKENATRSSINLSGIGNSTPTSRYSIFLSENKYLYTNTNYNVIGNYYFKDLLKSGPTFEKYTTTINYDNTYTLLGKLKGDDIYQWRTRAILYKNNSIVASYNEIGLGGNVENGMTTRKIDNDIYLYVRTSLIYTNKVYDLDVYYDEDSNTLEYNEQYTFVLGSGDSGYTSQNSTNDIIQNQNQNTQEVINTITNSGDFNGVMIGNLGLSGDIGSGDTNTIAGQLGYEERANPWQDFINRMLYDIGDVLMNNEDVDYTLGFHNTTSLTLHSRDFVLPDGPIKVFLNICLTYFIVVILYQEMKKIVNKINEGDYIYALNRGDAIEYFYM